MEHGELKKALIKAAIVQKLPGKGFENVLRALKREYACELIDLDGAITDDWHRDALGSLLREAGFDPELVQPRTIDQVLD